MGEKGSDFLQNNFLSVWHHFLLFEIERSKAAVKAWGNANGYLVFQVIAWHYVVILSANSNVVKISFHESPGIPMIKFDAISSKP